jgi:hypothetical protein
MAKRKRRPRKKPEIKPPEPQFPDFESVFSSLPSASDLLRKKESLTPIEERWLEFEEADYEGKIALCHQTIEEADLMDEENAFEMFNTLFYATVEQDERHRFEELAHKLRQHLPDIFAKQAHHILDCQIRNALAEGRLDDVLPLTQELAQTGGKYLDMFTHTLDMLDYHGQLPVLLKIMPLVWSDVKGGGYFDWAINEFASRGADYVVFDHLERNPSLEADNPELQEKLSFYWPDMDQEAFANFLDYLTGRANRIWTMDDFGFERKAQSKTKAKKPAKTAKLSEEARGNLYDLAIEFLRYLRQEEDVPYPKGRLARWQIYQYLVERHAGELEPREGMFEAMMRDPRKRRHKPKMRYPDHWLCPDRDTLERFLARLLDFLSGRYHEALATFELIPAWLRFLESRQLIDAGQHEKTLQDLQGLDTELLKIVKGYSDPALARAVEHWREG